MKPRTKSFYNLLSLIIGAAIFGAIFSIDPTKEYSWLGGMFHGGWVVGNWILSFFMDDHLVKAPIHTTSYNIFWWIGCVFVSLSCLGSFITLLFGKSNKK